MPLPATRKFEDPDTGHNLYFRYTRDGAEVFRIENGDPSGRLSLLSIATINAKNKIRFKPNREISPEEETEIQNWVESMLRDENRDVVDNQIRQINLIADWMSRKADSDELADRVDSILLAIHDLK